MADPIEEAILADEPSVITRNGEPVAVIVPVALYDRMVADLRAAEPNGRGGSDV